MNPNRQNVLKITAINRRWGQPIVIHKLVKAVIYFGFDQDRTNVAIRPSPRRLYNHIFIVKFYVCC